MFAVSKSIDIFFFVKINASVLNPAIDFQTQCSQIASMLYLQRGKSERLQNLVCSCSLQSSFRKKIR